MFDVVLPHARKSKWRSISLMYVLRALDKFAQGVGNVIIVGAKPPFLSSQAIFVEQADPGHRHSNTCQKVLTGLKQVQTERFILMTDDYFLCAPTDFSNYPNYWRKDLVHYKEPNPASFYHTVLHNTFSYLSRHNLPTKDFDGHAPTCLSTKLCLDNAVMWSGSSKTWVTPNDMSIISLTLNMEKIEGVWRHDIKSQAEIDKHMKDTFCFSTGRDSNMTPWLEENLPSKSRWEL